MDTQTCDKENNAAMKNIPFENKSVEAVFAAYPEPIKSKLLYLRELIFKTAAETEGVGELEETLKWGEPSYLAKRGSTIRINRNETAGGEYAIYFKCTSLLVPAFKKFYPTEFNYENNRAIHFTLHDKVPVKKLSHCIKLALTYHLIKHALKKDVNT